MLLSLAKIESASIAEHIAGAHGLNWRSIKCATWLSETLRPPFSRMIWTNWRRGSARYCGCSQTGWETSRLQRGCPFPSTRQNST